MNGIEYVKFVEIGGHEVHVTEENVTEVAIYETWTYGPSGNNRQLTFEHLRPESQTEVDSRGLIEVERPASRLWGKIRVPKGSFLGIRSAWTMVFHKHFPNGMNAADAWYHAENKQCGMRIIE